MAELLSGNRLDFHKEVQKEFLEECRLKLNLSNTEFASLLGISVRTLTDWKRKKFLLPEKAAKFLSNKAGVKIPEAEKLVDQFWYTKKGARKGATNMLKKYGKVGGDPKLRKEAWFRWWEKVGKFQENKILERKSISKPNKGVDLAEFVGIVLGDGGITKNQVTISLNRETDYEYIFYVKNLIKKLFNVEPSLRNDKKSLATNIVVSRIELVDFCKLIGLKIGNKVKQEVDMPRWIKQNRKFIIACVRGLVDTDGSIFEHKYRVAGKLYRYKKMDFASSSWPLLNSVSVALKKSGLKPRITKDGKKLRLESVEDVKKYFSTIGTSNPKHLKRYKM